MRYYDITNTTIVSQRQILKANPNTSFSFPLSPAALSAFGLAYYAKDPRPAYDENTQAVVEGPVEVRGDTAYQTYTVAEMSDAEKAVVSQNKKDAIIAEIASRRYDAEVGGVVINQDTGFMLDTSRETRAIMTSAIEWLSQQAMPVNIPWKHADGTFEELDVDALKFFQTQVANHVIGVFLKEKQLLEAIENGTYTEDMLQEKFPVEQIDPLIPLTDTP